MTKPRPSLARLMAETGSGRGRTGLGGGCGGHRPRCSGPVGGVPLRDDAERASDLDNRSRLVEHEVLEAALCIEIAGPTIGAGRPAESERDGRAVFDFELGAPTQNAVFP